jgi:hypothetical protein
MITHLHNRFHRARADLFVALMRPAPGSTLLDLGGNDGTFAAQIARQVSLSVTVADIEGEKRAQVERRGFRFMKLSHDAVLPFVDHQFDIVLCNSVIEHVTLPKVRCSTSARVPSAVWRKEARTAQETFAREISRVGRGYFVQTPHKHFVVDQHVLLPFVQYLSHNNICRVVQLTDRFWIKSCAGLVDWELLTPASMRTLFPAARVVVERFLGLPKSIIAFKGAPPVTHEHY